MTTLITGSSGHLGEALMRKLRFEGSPVIGLDIVPGGFTDIVGSITDEDALSALPEIDGIIHTATLHKPHVGTHARGAFIDINIHGTNALLELAKTRSIQKMVFTSTTSAFGASLKADAGAPAVWVTEDTPSVPKNIYGVTKCAAEDLCELYARKWGLNVLALRVSRFFPEEDDSKETRAGFSDQNAKANEFLFRRVDLEDVVSAHLLALEKSPEFGFGTIVISASSPFRSADCHHLQ
jgi:UDP-glucose 4-epimerase